VNWRSAGSPDAETWRRIVTEAGGPAELASAASWAAAGEHGWMALAVGWHESRLGTAFNKMPPENRNAFGLRPRGKPGYQAFDSWAEGVAEFRARITDPLYRYAPTRTLAEFVHVYSPDSDNRPGQEAEYVRTVETLLARWGATGGTDMPTITATACPIEIAVMTGPRPNRPALPMPSPSFVTVHEVGNTSPGADEEMHKRFVHNGGGPASVSFHFVVGPIKAIQLVYLNENAWHASDGFSGTGNRDTIAIETIQIGDFDKTMSHLAYLIAELFRNPGRFRLRPDVPYADDLPSDDARNRIRQHNHWAPDGKNCPQFIRGRGLWVPLLDAVERELRAGPPPKPRYAKPEPVDWKRGDVGTGTLGEAKAVKITAELTAMRNTQPRKYASGASERTGPQIDKGDKVVVIGALTVPGGKRPGYWYVRDDGSRLSASAFTPRLPFA
jgi:hypothetical protein